MANTLFFILVFTISKCIDVNSLELKQVLILSRHNIRTPLTENLIDFTSKIWPEWNEKPAYLTQKGARLEGYMGEYIFQWLNKEGLLPDSCPDEKDVYIYANTKQRTKESAKAFAKGAFRKCNVHVHHLNIKGMDPIFNPVIHNTTTAFRNNLIREIQTKLNGLKLTDAYVELDRIVDIKSSPICRRDSFCNLTVDKNEIFCEIGEEPNVSGPLFIGNAALDSFIMSFYDGKPNEDIAWGEITRPEQWELLTKLTKKYQDVRFNFKTESKDFANPLLKYISNIFLNETHKFVLLMGHDSNLHTVITALDFKSFVLPNQYEPFPIGGKIVFQKWCDREVEYLKVEYIYQTWSKLRDGAIINMDNPPQRVLLELNGCEINKNGLCAWDDFVKILENIE